MKQFARSRYFTLTSSKAPGDMEDRGLPDRMVALRWSKFWKALVRGQSIFDFTAYVTRISEDFIASMVQSILPLIQSLQIILAEV